MHSPECMLLYILPIPNCTVVHSPECMLLYILPIPSCSISGQWNGYVVHVQYIRACNIPVLYHLLLYPAVYVDLVFSCQVTETEGLVGRWKSFIGAEVSYTLIASCVLHHLHDRAVNNGY